MHPHYANKPLFGQVLLLGLLLCLLPTSVLSAQSLLEEGEQLFMENRPSEARPLLEQVVEGSNPPAKAFYYLGVVYEQLERYEEAVELYQRALERPGINRARVLFNMGNNYLHLGDREAAEEAYSRAVEANSDYAPAYLNRANGRVALESYEGALKDYSAYLALEPKSAQRPEIERMMEALRGIIEEQRIAAEEAERRRREEEERRRREEEERRQREEEERRVAEERRQRLLNSVLDSLEGASSETESASAGPEELESYEEELDIAD
ncbi:MAG: tetratricopeptide repeat protein [Alkalispirochaetaceae bacterium]